MHSEKTSEQYLKQHHLQVYLTDLLRWAATNASCTLSAVLWSEVQVHVFFQAFREQCCCRCNPFSFRLLVRCCLWSSCARERVQLCVSDSMEPHDVFVDNSTSA